jgi:CdiI immunity protein
MRAQLEHLARAYFHQDWELDSESAVAVVDTFVTDEYPAAAAELISEIDHVLASQLTTTSCTICGSRLWAPRLTRTTADRQCATG